MTKRMFEPEKWTDRIWSFRLPPDRFPNIVARLRGTPARASELVRHCPVEALNARVGGSWSAKEHIAHLDDLHELDETRLAEFAAGADVLSAADMNNTGTEEAHHNETSMSLILERFERRRQSWVSELEELSDDAIVVSSLHARLGQKLRLIDWVYFVAEHDDHHLVRARRSLLSVPQGE